MASLNLENLNQPPSRINEPKENSLVISSNYDLLNNDGLTVSWSNDGSVTIMRPAGLSNIKKIRFRNFKANQLPSLQLSLPSLNVSVKLTSNGADTGYVEGEDSPYGEYTEYNKKKSEGNTLLSFEKAWTYDASADSQLTHNIKECIEEVNRRMLIKFPVGPYYVHYDTGTNDFRHVQFDDYYVIPSAGSYPLCFKKDGQGKAYMLYPTQSSYNNIITIKPGTDRLPYYGAISFDKLWAAVVTEYNITGNSAYGETFFYQNNGSTESPSWGRYNISRWEDWTTNNAHLTIHPKSPGLTLGEFIGKSCILSSPMTGRGAGDGRRYTCIVAKSPSSATTNYWFYPNISGDDYVAYCMGTDVRNTTYTYILIFKAVNQGSNYYAVPVLYAFPTVLLTGSTRTSPVTPSDPEVRTFEAATIKEEWKVDSKWDGQLRFGTVGKESYGYCMYGELSTTNNNFIAYFMGSIMLKVVNDKIEDYYNSFAYKVNLGGIPQYCVKCSTGWGLKTNLNEFVDYISVYANNGNWDGKVNQAFSDNFNPVYNLGEFNNSLLLGTTYTGFVPDTVANNIFIGNSITQRNGWNCTSEDVLLLKSSITVNETEYQPVKLIDGFISTDINDFFIFEDDKVLTSQLNYTNQMSLAFSIFIDTKPYYFSAYNIIEYFTSSDYSLIHTHEPLQFSTLSESTLSLIETLILQRFEFNDMELVCPTFPSGDGVIFHTNEDSQVEFKEMAIDSTQDSITLQIISGGERLDLQTLKYIYGGVSISVDWVS